MTLDQLKKVVVCSTPAGITREGEMTFTFEALCEGAKMLGLELTSKRETFKALRGLGMTDTNSAGERRIAASLRIIVGIIVPVGKEVLAQIEASK